MIDRDLPLDSYSSVKKKGAESLLGVRKGDYIARKVDRETRKGTVN
jgi:hypothetical protein